MNDYLNPVRDIFIKYLFGKEKNKDLLLSFINAVLEDTDLPLIKDVTLKNPFNLKNFIMDKETILDVKALDEHDNLYDIEVQAGALEHFSNRILYYWARLYANQLEKGQDYYELKPVININLVDGILFKDIKKLHTLFLLTEKDDPNYILSDHLMIHFLEMQKGNQQLKSRLQHWIDFFKDEGKEDPNLIVLLKNDPIISKAHNEYTTFIQNDELRELYEAREKYRRDKMTEINTALKKGEEIGIKKGEEIGIKKGEEIGIKKSEEKIAKIVLNLFKTGHKLEDIAKLTGLTPEKLLQIKDELDHSE